MDIIIIILTIVFLLLTIALCPFKHQAELFGDFRAAVNPSVENSRVENPTVGYSVGCHNPGLQFSLVWTYPVENFKLRNRR